MKWIVAMLERTSSYCNVSHEFRKYFKQTVVSGSLLTDLLPAIYHWLECGSWNTITSEICSFPLPVSFI